MSPDSAPTGGSRKEIRQANFAKLLEFDRTCFKGPGTLAGVDEAGRGPLAGPVVAAAVILGSTEDLVGVNDSKKLSPAQREKFFKKIIRSANAGVGMADEETIDTLNIYEATRLAMKRAVQALSHTPTFLLVDGPIQLEVPVAHRGIVNGDQKSASIAAASIVAKVFRDRWMCRLHELYPAYSFDRHKGYGTAVHLEALRTLGPSPVHRRSFAPVGRLSAGMMAGVVI